jgi:hypothetical protein
MSHALPKRSFKNKDDAWNAIKRHCEENPFRETIIKLYQSICRRLGGMQKKNKEALRLY